MAFMLKKGNIPLDLLLVLIVFVSILSMFVIVGYTITDQIQDAMDSSGADLNTSAMNDTKNALGIFNTGLPFIFFSAIIISIMLAWYVKASPAMSIFLIMIIACIGYVAQGMSNAFYDMSRSTVMANASNEMGYMVYVQDNLPIFIIILGVVITIFMFAKPRFEM